MQPSTAIGLRRRFAFVPLPPPTLSL
jgi:hypothetical protein